MMDELHELELWLLGHGYGVERIDRYPAMKTIKEYSDLRYKIPDGFLQRHQLKVYSNDNPYKIWFDAICHWGSYGFENGLLEIMSDDKRLVRSEDGVEGWLTAKEIISRIQRMQEG